MKYNYCDIYKILSNLSDLYDDGMPVYYCFDLLKEISLTKKYKKSINIIAENIKDGQSIADSFGSLDIYPEFMIQLLKAAEENGSLSIAFTNLSSYYYSKYNIRKKIVSGITYPVVIIFSLIMFIIFITFCLIPEMYESFIEIQKDMPAILTSVYNFVKYTKNFSIFEIIFSVFGIILGIISFNIILFKLGFIKSIFYKTRLGKNYIEYKFIIFLKMILISGSSVSSVLKMNINYKSLGVSKKCIDKFIKGIEEGIQISESIIDFKFISKYTIGMIKIGESRGKLSESLSNISDFLEKRINKKMNKITELVQPVFICVIAVIMISIILCFVGPILDMMDIKGTV